MDHFPNWITTLIGRRESSQEEKRGSKGLTYALMGVENTNGVSQKTLLGVEGALERVEGDTEHIEQPERAYHPNESSVLTSSLT
jgi:hypothetical protein